MPRLIIPKTKWADQRPGSLLYIDLCLSCWPPSPAAILYKYPVACGGDYYSLSAAIKTAGAYGGDHPVYSRGVFRCVLCGKRLGKMDD